MNTFENFFIILFLSYLIPLAIPLAAVLLWIILGNAAFFCLLFNLFLIIITNIISKKSIPYKRKKTGNTDARIETINELIEEIKFAKMQNFELEVGKTIRKIQKNKNYFLNILAIMLSVCIALYSNMIYTMTLMMFLFKMYFEEEKLSKATVFFY